MNIHVLNSYNVDQSGSNGQCAFVLMVHGCISKRVGGQFGFLRRGLPGLPIRSTKLGASPLVVAESLEQQPFCDSKGSSGFRALQTVYKFCGRYEFSGA